MFCVYLGFMFIALSVSRQTCFFQIWDSHLVDLFSIEKPVVFFLISTEILLLSIKSG